VNNMKGMNKMQKLRFGLGAALTTMGITAIGVYSAIVVSNWIGLTGWIIALGGAAYLVLSVNDLIQKERGE